MTKSRKNSILKSVEKTSNRPYKKIKPTAPSDNSNTTTFDAIDNVIALSWEEETNSVDFENVKRLVFKFGETEQDVKDKLYERDIVLEFEKKVVYEN
jgi:hypothetical protein